MEIKTIWRMAATGARLRVMVVATVLVSTAAAANEPVEPLQATDSEVLDCWVSSDMRREVVSYFIRCIKDRPYVDPGNVNLGSIDGLLDYVHQMIHAGEFLALDRDLANGLESLIAGDLRSIQIHQYPYEESWEARLPQRLVQAVLCDANSACPVHLFRGQADEQSN